MSPSFGLSIHLSRVVLPEPMYGKYSTLCVCVETYPASWCGRYIPGFVCGHKGLVTHDATTVAAAWAAIINSRRAYSKPMGATG
eukprot:2365897-Pyramimonas_sp.AAC.1